MQFSFGNRANLEPQFTEPGLDYDPAYWNRPNRIGSNNCYTYAVNCCFESMDQGRCPWPGESAGKKPAALSPELIDQGLLSDGLIPAPLIDSQLFPAPKAGYYLCAFLFRSRDTKDYHFVRQHPDGTWSHKLGLGERVTNCDRQGVLIADPRQLTCNGPEPEHEIFVGFYYVPIPGILLRRGG